MIYMLCSDPPKRSEPGCIIVRHVMLHTKIAYINKRLWLVIPIRAICFCFYEFIAVVLSIVMPIT